MGAELSIVIYTSCYFVLITQDKPLQLYYVIEYNLTDANVPIYYEPTGSQLSDLNSIEFPFAYNGTQPKRYYTKDAVPFIIGPFSIFEKLNMLLTLSTDTFTTFVFFLSGDPLVTPLCSSKYNGTCVVRNKIVNISGFCGDYSYCNGREYCNLDGICINPGQTCSPGFCCLDNISLGFGNYTTGRCYTSANTCSTTSIPPLPTASPTSSPQIITPTTAAPTTAAPTTAAPTTTAPTTATPTTAAPTTTAPTTATPTTAAPTTAAPTTTAPTTTAPTTATPTTAAPTTTAPTTAAPTTDASSPASSDASVDTPLSIFIFVFFGGVLAIVVLISILDYFNIGIIKETIKRKLRNIRK